MAGLLRFTFQAKLGSDPDQLPRVVVEDNEHTVERIFEVASSKKSGLFLQKAHPMYVASEIDVDCLLHDPSVDRAKISHH